MEFDDIMELNQVQEDATAEDTTHITEQRVVRSKVTTLQKAMRINELMLSNRPIKKHVKMKKCILTKTGLKSPRVRSQRQNFEDQLSDVESIRSDESEQKGLTIELIKRQTQTRAE